MHMWWEWEALYSFWIKVFIIISQIIDQSLTADPVLALLSIENNRNARVSHKMLVFLLLAVARTPIASQWKFCAPPLIDYWFYRVWDLGLFELLTY